jgi:hypothetical protein
MRALPWLLLAGCAVSPSRALEVGTLRYLRAGPTGGRPECAFTVRTLRDGWSIESVTGSLRVFARYDARDRLVEAEVRQGESEPARARREGDRLVVTRPGAEAQDFDAPPGLIVTSAPDWTDLFRIARLWDHPKGGRQEFAGLWMHPAQPAQRLTFSAERRGEDEAGLDGTVWPLDRLLVRIRGNSPYAVWTDREGRLVKLVSLPFGERSTVIVAEGFERAAAALRPD